MTPTYRFDDLVEAVEDYQRTTVLKHVLNRALRRTEAEVDVRMLRDEIDEGPPPDGVSISGGFALWPLAGADRMTWLVDDDATTIDVALSARNAKARTWRATIRAQYWSGMEDEDYEISGIKLEWDKNLRRVRHATPPTPRRAWTARHTPWALWREWRFRREMRQLQNSAPTSDDAD